MYEYELDLSEVPVGDLREGDQILLDPSWIDPPQGMALWTLREAEIWGDEAVRDYVSEVEDAGHGLVTVETADGRMLGPWSAGLYVVARRAIREPS